MELPKFTAPTSMAPNLSLTNSVQNAGNVSIPSVQAPKLDNLMGGEASSKVGSTTGALGNLGSIAGGAAIGGLAGAAVGKLTGKNSKITALGGAVVGGLVGASAGKLTSGVGNNVDYVKSSMSNLQGAARAKVMANAPELPEQAKGMSGVMEKGVDLGKFQEKSVGNLMSKVSDFSPGKSITDLAKEKDISSGLKDKLNSLKPSGALGGALSGALGGAGIGAAVGALAGGGKNVLANAAKGAGIGAAVGGITGAISAGAGGAGGSGGGGIMGAAEGLTSKLGSALGGGAVGNTLASGVAGALGGAALGKLTGQSVNLKGVAGNLAGSVGGGIGAQIGSKLTGNTVPSAGIGAALGGAVSGLVGGSAGKKALTGLAAGVGLGVVTGVVTNKINNAFGLSKGSEPTAPQSSQPNTAIDIASSQQAVQSDTSTTTPDLSKNTVQEIDDLANKSPQSVPPPQPIPSTETSISSPDIKTEETYNTIGTTSSNAIEEARALNERYKSNEITGKYISTDILSRKLFMLEMNTFIQKKYSGFFKAKSVMEIRALMEKDIAKVSAADRALVKDVISSYKGTFSMAYSGATDKVISDPENRTLSLNDYLAMDTEDFYKFLTNVAEGQFEVKALTSSTESAKPPYKVFISKKSDSEVNLTISNPAYGTGTATIPKAVPPSMDVLFNMLAIKECVSVYHFGKIYPTITATPGTMDTLNPKDGAYFRMWANSSDDGSTAKMRYCCGNNIIIDQQSTEETYASSNEKKYNVKDLKETPPEVSWDLPGWVAKVKIAKDLYYTVSYNPYTIQINTIQVVKMVPKT